MLQQVLFLYLALQVSVLAQTVDIIAFTGQSNTIHVVRNKPPYSTVEVPVPCVFDNGSSQPNYYDDLQSAVKASQFVGGVWEFAKHLHETGYNDGRFGVVQTGLGGRAAWEWGGGVRYVEFRDAVNEMAAKLRLKYPGFTVRLKAVVINQGEREGETGVPWKDGWGVFFRTVKAEFNVDTQFYIQSLNTAGLMPHYLDRKANWDKMKSFQLAFASRSGSVYSRANTYVFDANKLGGSENTSTLVRDNRVHYSDKGIALLSAGTMAQFQEVNRTQFSDLPDSPQTSIQKILSRSY